MKLFREYYAGHINHDFHLFGDDDIAFLKQFKILEKGSRNDIGDRLWKLLIIERYTVDLPKALQARDERRQQPLAGFERTQSNYYEYIEAIAIQLRTQITHQPNGINATAIDRETKRINKMVKDTAKNIVDSQVAEYNEGNNAWLIASYDRTDYFGFAIENNYIKELVKRMEDKPGGSAKGYDLSNIRNFIEGEGNWKTDGFTCPNKDIIGKNFLAWVGFTSQGLLHDPSEFYGPLGMPDRNDNEFVKQEKEEAASGRREAHRIAARKYYNPNIRTNVSYDPDRETGGLKVTSAEAPTNELLNDLLYKKVLRNKYNNLINQMLDKLTTPDPETGEVPQAEIALPNNDADLMTLQRILKTKIPAEYKRSHENNPTHPFYYAGKYCYQIATRGDLVRVLERLVLNVNPENYTPDNIRTIIKNIKENQRNKKDLIDGLVDIELLTKKINMFHPNRDEETLRRHRSNNPESELTEFPHILDVEKNDPIQTINTPDGAELKKGKILFHIDSVREKLQKKLEKARAYGNTHLIQKLERALRDLEDKIITHGVGHHFDVLSDNPATKGRGKLFLQFGHESEVPKYGDEEDDDYIYDMRLKNLAGGLDPNQNMPGAKGPKATTNIQNVFNNLTPFFINGNRGLVEIIRSYTSENYNGDHNIILKTFMNPDGNTKSGNKAAAVFNLYVQLVKDEMMRNMGMFDNRDDNNAPTVNNNQTKQAIKTIINRTLKRLMEKDVGLAGTVRMREGEIADIKDVKRQIENMLQKIAPTTEPE